MTELPHTRTRMVHWLSTAVALAAVVGGSAFLQPSDATARPTDVGSVTAPRPPDAAKARYPLHCGSSSSAEGREVHVQHTSTADFDGDGRSETVALVRCRAGGGTPPNGLYVLADPGHPGGRPAVVSTLVPDKEGMTVRGLKVRGRTVSGTLLGYSSRDVPRCCPDQQRKVKWEWKKGQFALEPEAAAGGAQSV